MTLTFIICAIVHVIANDSKPDMWEPGKIPNSNMNSICTLCA